MSGCCLFLTVPYIFIVPCCSLHSVTPSVYAQCYDECSRTSCCWRGPCVTDWMFHLLTAQPFGFNWTIHVDKLACIHESVNT